jgi:sortase A
VGHIPGTALPGDSGNVGLAAHRDTFFRRLRDIRPDDEIVLTTPDGTFRYTVEGTKVVEPGDVWVLDPTEEPALTLVTCYPFTYVGSAPQRFIVRAPLEARDGSIQ